MATIATVVSILAFTLAVVNFVVTLVLTRRRDIGAIRPVLVFTYKNEGWHIENIGNGPALDLIFHRLSGELITQKVRLPALASGTTFYLHFARHDSKQTFVATYLDADGRRYTSRSQHDVSTSMKGFDVDRPLNSESLDRWWMLKDSNE